MTTTISVVALSIRTVWRHPRPHYDDADFGGGSFTTGCVGAHAHTTTTAIRRRLFHFVVWGAIHAHTTTMAISTATLSLRGVGEADTTMTALSPRSMWGHRSRQ